MHVIDADKLIEFIDIGISHSSINSMIEPINSDGEYDVVIDKKDEDKWELQTED